MPRSAEQTRARVLEAAYKLFRRQGYSRVTMDDIAEAAKLTKRTLYHHFNSKDQLLADVLESQHHLALQAFRTFGDNLSGGVQSPVGERHHRLQTRGPMSRRAASAHRLFAALKSCA